MVRSPLSAWLACLLTGCVAGSTPLDAASDAGRDASRDARDAMPSIDVGTDAARVCLARCTSESDCPGACALPPGSVACCEFTSHTCYSAMRCPAVFVDAGLDAMSDAACYVRPPTSLVTVDAPSAPGATFRWRDSAVGAAHDVVLDASGHGEIELAAFVIATDAASAHTLHEGTAGMPFVISIVQGSVEAELRVQTPFPDDAPNGVSAVHLFVGRDIATSECVASAVSVVQDCAPRAGLDDPTRLDDAPCGPFR